MPIHDAVHPYLRRSLSLFFDKIRPLSWTGRARMADAALNALTDAEDLPDDLSPIQEFPKIVAALITNMGCPPVTEGEQALLYSVSALREHRDAGSEWLEAHPEEAAVLDDCDPTAPTIH